MIGDISAREKRGTSGSLGYIASFFIEQFLAHAPASLDRSALLEDFGWKRDEPIPPGQMVADSDFFSFLEKIAATGAAGRAAAILVGAGVRCDDYGAFGLAFKSAETIQGSFLRVERFGKVVTSIANFKVIKENQSAFMEVQPGPDQRLGLHMTNELAIAAATSLSREVGNGSFTPRAISFRHDAPTDVSAFEAHFDCPLVFNAERDGITIDDDLLTRSNRLGDAKTSEFFDEFMEKELANRQGEPRLEQRVRAQISAALSEGVPIVANVAGKLGMSGRSLQRRLAERGFEYQTIVDDARRDLAENLLIETDYSLAEIAFLTGYSEQSTFTKAFKRWRGVTPRTFRLDKRPITH